MTISDSNNFTIFLDLDGPVFEGKLRHYKCYYDIINKYGGIPLKIDEYWQMKRCMVKRDIILEKSNFQADYHTFFNEWMSIIENPEYLNYDSLKPNVLETLIKWHQLKYKIVLVTMRQNRNNLLKQLETFEIFSYFHEIIDCPPLRINTKYEALKNYSFKKSVFIGDTEEDIKTAKLLGIKSIGIKTGIRDENFLDSDFLADEIYDIDFNFLGII